MGDNFQYGDLLFLGLIAAFVLLRLRSMLGKDKGLDPREAWRQATREMTPDRVVQITEAAVKAQKKEEDTILEKLQDAPQAAEGLRAIKQADAQFSPTEFVHGAKLAFEWMVAAFSKGEKDKLKMLLSDERYQIFAGEIDARAQSGQFQETTLVSIAAADITDVAMRGSRAQITVQFSSEQIHIVRDKDGAIISGNQSAIENVVDVWTFERDTSSKDPNWKITAT